MVEAIQNLSDTLKADTDVAVLQLSDALHRAMLDQYAVVKRCIPHREKLEIIIKKIAESRKNLKISTFSPKEYQIIFKMMFAPQNSIPDENKLQLIAHTFRYMAALNKRQDGMLDADDLWVLAMMYNILCYEENEDAYLKKFENWRA